MPVPPILSAAWPLDVAIATVIETECARDGSLLGTLLDTPPVYSGEARAADGSEIELAPGYVVLNASTEGGAAGAAFGRPRAENGLTIDIWTADTSKKSGLLIHGEIRRLLHRQPVTLEGYGVVRGSLELIVSLMDPTRTAYHVQERYRVVSFPPRAE